MQKVLIVSGCSFTFEEWNWPGHLGEMLNLKVINVGMASQGNGLISRKLLYALDKALLEYKPEEILVGVMWSGTDRADFHSFDRKNVLDWGGFSEDTPRVKNPTSIVDDNFNWHIMNQHWENRESKIYYSMFHTAVQGMLYSVEHILRVQWYLEKLNIPYFMSTFTSIFTEILVENPEIEYLYKKIDFSSFLPTKGCYEWVLEHYKDDGGFNVPDNKQYLGIHPTSFGHQQFAKKVIIPHLIEKQIIKHEKVI